MAIIIQVAVIIRIAMCSHTIDITIIRDNNSDCQQYAYINRSRHNNLRTCRSKSANYVAAAMIVLMVGKVPIIIIAIIAAVRSTIINNIIIIVLMTITTAATMMGDEDHGRANGNRTKNSGKTETQTKSNSICRDKKYAC